MKETVDTELEAVPEVVLEAYIKQEYGNGMTRIRVEGSRYDLDNLVSRFTALIQQNRYATKVNFT